MHEAMFALLAAAGRDLAGPPFARLVPDAPADGTITLDAGVPTIKPLAAPGGDIVVGELPAGPAATLLVVGPLTELPAAHATLQRWLAASGRAAAGPGWQVFLTNPITEPDPAKQQTKVFVPLVPLARGEASP
jgi:DNA gyrase inhibitor GyrI